MAIDDALARAEQVELDLVEVAPESSPPVCRLVDYGKYKYLQKKNTRKQKPSQVKEINLRPHIGQHDLAVKMGRLKNFLQDGCKTKLKVMFRGREFAHQNTGFELISSIVAQVSDLGKVDSPAKLEGRSIVAVLSPASGAVKAAESADKAAEKKLPEGGAREAS